jgi:hypothetical protein
MKIHRALVIAAGLVSGASAAMGTGCGSSSAGAGATPDGSTGWEEAGDAGEVGDSGVAGDDSGGGAAHDGASDTGPAGPPVSTVFSIDVPNVVRRSNIVLGHPNTTPQDSMALGNGTLGVAEWAAGGFTAQINRTDTLPDRKAVAQVTIPGLAALTTAADFAGHVDLYDAMLEESGGGMTATIFVRADAAEIVIDVAGADPSSMQTATLKLWSGRSPTAGAAGAVATLAETWGDDAGLGASGQTFGALSAITAAGQNVAASVVDPLTVQVSFRPNADGSFRVVVGAPQWSGGDAASTATALLGSDATTPLATLSAGHLAYWHGYWGRVGLVELDSQDGVAEYVENLRTLYLFYAAAEGRGTLPGSQAGLADLFDFLQDQQPWLPPAYWVWNLRMQIAANMGAGAFDLNAPAFTLYRTNIAAIEAWTQSKMGVAQGICLPETMRFNGNGYWYGGEGNASCDKAASPSYNALTLTSGTEVGLWVWNQYRMTGDAAFLTANYPLMREAARFLLASAQPGSDGTLHTTANAHETQWDVQDPVTDIVAMQALFPAVVAAAGILGTDAALVSQLGAALQHLPPLPRTDPQSHSMLLSAADDDAGTDVFAISYQPGAPQHNSENLDLEAVFPYDLIGDEGPLTALAQRTYAHRMFTNAGDWSFDAVDAARLGLASEVLATLTRSIQNYQSFPNGLALLGGGSNSGMSEPYVEELGIVALAVNEAAVQDYDGLLRISPALPAGWSAAGTVFVQGGSKVDFQIKSGAVSAVFVEVGSTGTVTARNPWPGGSTQVVDGDTGKTIAPATPAAQVTFPGVAGHWVALVPAGSAVPTVKVTGAPATAAKTFGPVTIGLP